MVVFSNDLDRQRSKEVSEDSPPHEDDREGDEDRGSDHEGLEDNHEDREDIKNKQLFDSYCSKQSSENEPIKMDSSKESVYKLRHGAEDDLEENPDDREEPEVISDSGSDEEYNDYPMDSFIPIQDDSDDSEVQDHPFDEIVEPEHNEEEQRQD